MGKHNELGIIGEEIAARYLEQKGYDILQRNFRFKHLELDIIAQIDSELVIVEVKTRESSYLTDPAELVSKKKQNDLIKAANAYIDQHEIDLDCRFDLVIIIKNNQGEKVDHIPDAFGP